MSEEKKCNMWENELCSDDDHIENLEVNTTTTTLNSTEVPPNSPGASNNIHHVAEGIEVNAKDVLIVEDVSHKLLRESSGENSELKVTYEFPSDDESAVVSSSTDTSSSEGSECKVVCDFSSDYESKNVSIFPQDYKISFHKSSEVFDRNEFRSVLQIAKDQKDKLIEILGTKSVNKEATDDTYTAGTSKDSDRKRKKGPISLVLNKRQKEVQDCSSTVNDFSHGSVSILQVKNSNHSSDEFADIEDNIKDSHSSDNSDSNFPNEIKKQLPLKDLDSSVYQRNGRKSESVTAFKTFMMSYESSSSSSNNPQNKKTADKTAEKTPLSSALKGDILPVFKLSNEMKRKFELSMPTIPEVKESKSAEQIPQTVQSKTNPLKMKTKVTKGKNKCNFCGVRLGLCAIQCRCGGYYCAKHRYDKEHNCTFDYKSMGATEIRKNNPRVVAEKIRKL